MRILDVDLDFFLKTIPEKCSHGEMRLPEEENNVWSEAETRRFLEGSLGLNKGKRIPARFVTKHDEMLDKLVQIGILNAPVCGASIVHVDSHADLGFGSFAELRLIGMSRMTVKSRRGISLDTYRNTDEDGGMLDEGNYLLYAVFLELFSQIDYVFNGYDLSVEVGYDLPHRCIMPRDNAHSFYLRIPKLKAGLGVEDLPYSRLFPSEMESCDRNTTVELRLVRPEACHYDGAFEMAFLAHSPNYTPKSADALLPILCDYLDFGSREEKIRMIPLAP